MTRPRRERAAAIADGAPLVSADPATVAWLTGVAVDIEWGPSPFSAAPVVVLSPGGDVTLVVSEDEAPAAGADVRALTFPGFALEDVDRPQALLELTLDAIGSDGPIVADLHALPGSLVAALGPGRLRDVRHALQDARAVKDPDEIDAIKAATEIADAGQAAARASLRPGADELGLWTETRAAMERLAQSRLPVLADFVTGERTAEVGEGDLLLVDLVPRVGSYWADSCATVALGGPPAAARSAHAAALRALEAAKASIRPGVTAGEVDRAAREVMETAGGYPHHTGHGLGVTVHEAPRIVPGSAVRLTEGMVLALEPGAYGDEWGVRVEQVVVVTADGCDVLSGHDLAL